MVEKSISVHSRKILMLLYSIKINSTPGGGRKHVSFRTCVPSPGYQSYYYVTIVSD